MPLITKTILVRGYKNNMDEQYIHTSIHYNYFIEYYRSVFKSSTLVSFLSSLSNLSGHSCSN